MEEVVLCTQDWMVVTPGNSSAMGGTSKFQHLLSPGQVPRSEVEKKIYYCAAEANLSKAQWDLMLETMGAEKVEDLLELDYGDYASCDFAPLLHKRLLNFQAKLLHIYWRFTPRSREEVDVVMMDGSDVCLAVLPHVPPAPPAFPGTENLCQKHKPSQNRVGLLKYWYFNAVKHGCQECVRTLVQDMGVDKDVISNTQGYTAMHFAVYFKQPEMMEFLGTL